MGISRELGSFAPLIWHCLRILDFDNKRRYFQHRLKEIQKEHLRGHIGSSRVRLTLRRHSVFEDSFHQIKYWKMNELFGKLSVQFLGEDGIDVGGLTREWYQLMANDIFHPKYLLFKSSIDNNAVQPNMNSYYNSDHLENFKFAGLFVAKAIIDSQVTYYLCVFFFV